MDRLRSHPLSRSGARTSRHEAEGLGDGTAQGCGLSEGVMRKFWNSTVVMGTQPCERTKNTEYRTLQGLIYGNEIICP